MEYKKRFASCKHLFEDDDRYACSICRSITERSDDIWEIEIGWGCKECKGWEKSEDWTEENEREWTLYEEE